LDYWRDSPALFALAAAVLAGSAIAGLYPAVVLSGFHPAQGLSTTRTPAGGRIGHIVREILAVVQFTAASAFFIIIAGLAAQVRHMETAELGFARDGLLMTDAMITRLMPPEQALAIQDAWRRTPGIVAVAAGPVPGRYFIAPRWRFRMSGRADEIDMQMAWMEGDFFAAYRTGRLAGRLLNADDDGAEPGFRLPSGSRRPYRHARPGGLPRRRRRCGPALQGADAEADAISLRLQCALRYRGRQHRCL
ncbi:MAG: hypothetical protein JF571_11960, partial [Asticcacaulis sp.]|nr:hypothetical protein [Asticcacaulis sp.]